MYEKILDVALSAAKERAKVFVSENELKNECKQMRV
jgi:hypothetical protein